LETNASIFWNIFIIFIFTKLLNSEQIQNEGSFGCEVVARAMRQPNVPEFGRVFIFHFCLIAANYHYRCLFSACTQRKAFYSSFSGKGSQKVGCSTFWWKIFFRQQENDA